MRTLHAAVLELDHLVGEPADRAVVRGDHERDAHIHQRADAVHHEGPGLRVELRGRLVGDDDGGARDDGLREGRSLLLPTGELVGQVVDAMTDPEPIEDVALLRPPRSAPGQAQMLADREVGQEVVRRPLEHVADHVPPEAPQAARRCARHVLRTHPHVARRGAIDAGQHPQERGLPAPRGTDDSGERTRREAERHAAERVHGAGGRSVRLDEIDAAGRYRLTRQRAAPPPGRSPRPSGGRAIRRPPTPRPGPRGSRGPRRSEARTTEPAGSSAAGPGAAR